MIEKMTLIKDVEYEDLHYQVLDNALYENVTFTECYLLIPHFTTVEFKNCTFTSTILDEQSEVHVTYTDCSFIRVDFQGSSRTPSAIFIRPYWQDCTPDRSRFHSQSVGCYEAFYDNTHLQVGCTNALWKEWLHLEEHYSHLFKIPSHVNTYIRWAIPLVEYAIHLSVLEPCDELSARTAVEWVRSHRAQLCTELGLN